MHRYFKSRAGVGGIAVTLGVLLLALPPLDASAETLAVSVGAGLRTSLTRYDESNSNFAGTDFNLDSARIYLSGKVTDQISFMFNTEYDGEQIQPIDAVAQFSFSEMFNIWAGRFLPPSDRANLYGPYYASHWNVYTDGVQDGYPSMTTGRDDGVAYWGQFGMVKVSAGVFDVPSTRGATPTSGNDALYAARVQVDLWDPEPGYYLNGTYYGEKDLLAFGVATQSVGSDNAYTVDALLEKKLGGAGVITLEGEYAKYEGFAGGYTGNKSDGYYLLAAYLFPQQIGPGKFQILAKHAKTDFEFTPSTGNYSQTTNEVNFNYLIKAFNARISGFYITSDYDDPFDYTRYGLGLQIQM